MACFGGIISQLPKFRDPRQGFDVCRTAQATGTAKQTNIRTTPAATSMLSRGIGFSIVDEEF
jgi:hypothetical protein